MRVSKSALSHANESLLTAAAWPERHKSGSHCKHTLERFSPLEALIPLFGHCCVARAPPKRCRSKRAALACKDAGGAVGAEAAALAADIAELEVRGSG